MGWEGRWYALSASRDGCTVTRDFETTETGLLPVLRPWCERLREGVRAASTSAEGRVAM